MATTFLGANFLQMSPLDPTFGRWTQLSPSARNGDDGDDGDDGDGQDGLHWPRNEGFAAVSGPAQVVMTVIIVLLVTVIAVITVIAAITVTCLAGRPGFHGSRT